MELDFLDGSEEPAEPVRVEEAPPAQEQPAAEQAEAQAPADDGDAPQPRGPDGKFSSKSAKPEPGHVPLSAMLDERDRRKQAEERLRAFESQQQRQPAPQPGSPEYVEQVRSDVQQQVVNERLNFSEKLARKEYGAETVEGAKEWALARFAQNPAYQAEVLSHPDPYEFVVVQFKQQQALSALSDPAKLDAFLAWQATQQNSPGDATPQQPAAPSPPRSLVSAPGAGVKPGHQPVGEGVAFSNLFTR